MSIYSHRSAVHDAITLLPGSLKRSVAGIRLLRSHGVKVVIANVLMMQNRSDRSGVQQLANQLGAEYTIDPTITPMMDGERSVLRLGLGRAELKKVFRDPDLVGDVADFCAPPQQVSDDVLRELPCSAGHCAGAAMRGSLAGPPASINPMLRSESSLRRAASTDPAVPEPITRKSNQ